MDDVILRAETLDDYNAIACLTYESFYDWKPEKLHIHESELITLARQRKSYDRELSIVAEFNGEIIGHILLVSTEFMVLGKVIKGVLLGPVCVSPQHKKQGIGSRLISYGHKIAKDKGYELSLLCGHADYYPRFGYIANTFSFNGIEVRFNNEIEDVDFLGNLTTRPLAIQDIPTINKWQMRMQKKNNLSILFENNLIDYHANSIDVESFVILDENEIVGYVNRYVENPAKIKCMFYKEEHLSKIIMYLYSTLNCPDTLILPIPINAFEPIRHSLDIDLMDIRKSSKYFMICPLSETSIINEYCRAIINNDIDLGVISYPPYCDVDV